MAFNMRSIMGRNNPNPGPAFPGQANPSNKLTVGDVETAKAHGITSKRAMKKNLGDIRSVQSSQATQNIDIDATQLEPEIGLQTQPKSYDNNTIYIKDLRIIDRPL